MNKGLVYGIGGISLAFLVGGIFLYNKNKEIDKSETTPSKKLTQSTSSTKSPSTSSTPKVDTPTTTTSDMTALAKNLGVKAASIITVPFNSKKNSIQFYSNGRFSVNDTAKKLITKGSWSDGGKKLTPDGGKLISSASVWNNISQTISVKK